MGKVREDANLIIRALEKRELADRVVFPGETYGGFICFILKDNESVQSVSGVQAKVKNTKPTWRNGVTAKGIA